MKKIHLSEQTQKTLNCSGYLDYFSPDTYAYAKIHRFDTKEYILFEDQAPDYLYFVVEGKAKAYLTHHNGKVSLVSLLYAPCFIGEMELLDAQQKTYGIQALTTVDCIALPMQKIRDTLLTDPVFLRKLCLYLSKKSDLNSRTYTHNIAFPLENRLARFIQITANDNIYAEKHTETAEYLGVTYRHLLYVFAHFVKKGILIKTSKGYQIANQAALLQLASTTN